MHRLACLPVLFVLLSLPAPVLAQGAAPVRDRQQQAVARRATASIAGRVVAADTGRPLRLVRVTATAPENSEGRLAITDENGAFELADLPAGRYTVTAAKASYVPVVFGQRRPLRAGRPVELREGQRVAGIDFRLPRGSAITGRVIDQDGEPLVRASIRTFRYRFVQGERRLEPGQATETDDRGIFRVFGLTPGTYFVSAIAQTAYLLEVATRASNDRIRMMARPAEAFTYAPTYYPGVAALSGATPITVGVADEVGGVDFTLQLVAASRVTGTVLGANGAPTGNAMVQLLPDDMRGTSGQTYTGTVERSGRFSIVNVPPGRYVAVAFGTGRDQRGTHALQMLSVSGALVSDVNFVLAPGVSVSGQVTSDGAAALSPQEMSRVRVGLWSPANASLPGFGQANTTVRPDGSFSLPDIPPGNRMVRVSGLPASWTLKAVYLDGRDITDEPMDVKTSEPIGRLAIVVSDKPTTISGAAIDERGQPLNDYTVIAFPTDSTLWRPMSRFIQAGRPDKDGTYTIRGLPPGEYLLCALDDVDQGEWYDPGLLQALRASAVRVLLQEGDAKSQELKILVSSQ